MLNNFVVYVHFILGTNSMFYIGEGKPKRPFDVKNRNKEWNKIVGQHGFRVVILRKGLTKLEAEALETKLIVRAKRNGKSIVNLSMGPCFGKGNSWLRHSPKVQHPMYGRKNPNPKLAAYNRTHSGRLSNTFGLVRSDLSDRNKTNNPSVKRKVRCIETGQTFTSIKEAGRQFNSTQGVGISRVLNGERKKAFGHTWEYAY